MRSVAMPVIPNPAAELWRTAVRNLLFVFIGQSKNVVPENCAISPITIFRMNTCEKSARNYV